MTAPDPGTREAQDQGCTCPVLDNAHRHGYRGVAGVFVYNADCKLHAEEFRAQDNP